ncbi:hypothetical protein SAMN04487988_105125 [Algoriphagus hitonicola]|uniref:Uncharacterized protein n=1 Tax=Algoriphagus hitonicola TaxID=435880 RepID=A0A1I2T585_9BACT|nr:hypothetical protein SAMN04487988_105125 [Algoriphagus hitonicola]
MLGKAFVKLSSETPIRKNFREQDRKITLILTKILLHPAGADEYYIFRYMSFYASIKKGITNFFVTP